MFVAAVECALVQVPGVYQLLYTVLDMAGNMATPVMRQVEVAAL